MIFAYILLILIPITIAAILIAFSNSNSYGLVADPVKVRETLLKSTNLYKKCKRKK